MKIRVKKLIIINFLEFLRLHYIIYILYIIPYIKNYFLYNINIYNTTNYNQYYTINGKTLEHGHCNRHRCFYNLQLPYP